MWSEQPAPRAAPSVGRHVTSARLPAAALLPVMLVGLASAVTITSGSSGSGDVLAAVPGMPARGGIPACGDTVAGSPAPARGIGSWWRTEPVLDATGTLHGWTLETGDTDGTAHSITLPAESSVTGPNGGLVVVASDDGRASTVRVMEAANGGCEIRLQPPAGIVRRAILGRDGEVLAHLIARHDRADLGTWRLSRGRSPVRVLAPLDHREREAAGIERVWSTDLLLDATGERLAVQSCDDRRCLVRVVDLRSGRTFTVRPPYADSGQGALIGFAGDRLLSWEGGHGLPAAILSWDLGSGRPNRVVEAATGAAVTTDGRTLVVSTAGEDGEQVVAFDLAPGASSSATAPPAGGARPFRPGPGATISIEPGGEEVPALTPDGRAVLVRAAQGPVHAADDSAHGVEAVP